MTRDKTVIAIIPARVGSKRILNKNIIPLAGKPMLAWTIEAAIQSGIFDDILVSTDSQEIADLSRSLGADVPFLRSLEDADDVTPAAVATANALIPMEAYKKKEYDVVVQLMPNCPCRTSEDIVKAYDHFVLSANNFQISVFKYGWMNPWWALKLKDAEMLPQPLFPKALKTRSQDLEGLYCPTGAIWIAKGHLLKKEKTFYGHAYRVFPMEWENAVDIDNEADLRMAKTVFMMRRNQYDNR